MAAANLGPLDWRIPIVTPEGRPTVEFQRRWATQIGNNSQIGGITIGSGPPPGSPAPADGAQYADTSTTPYTLYIGNGGSWHQSGSSSANPTAIAGDVAVNGTANTYMRSDAAPAIRKGSSTQFGIFKVDGTTITESGGVISAVGGGPVSGPAWINGWGFDRRTIIGVTATGGFSGVVSNMLMAQDSPSFYWNSGSTTKELIFTFPNPNRVTGFSISQMSSGTANGIWTFAGSTNNVTYVNIDTAFVVGGTGYIPSGGAVSSHIYAKEFTNANQYKYYKFTLNAGQSTNSGPYFGNVGFKSELLV